MQNTVVSTENEWGGKESEEYGTVRGSEDFPGKQDPGMGLLGQGVGRKNNKTVTDFLKIKEKKSQKT